MKKSYSRIVKDKKIFLKMFLYAFLVTTCSFIVQIWDNNSENNYIYYTDNKYDVSINKDEYPLVDISDIVSNASYIEKYEIDDTSGYIYISFHIPFIGKYKLINDIADKNGGSITAENNNYKLVKEYIYGDESYIQLIGYEFNNIYTILVIISILMYLVLGINYYNNNKKNIVKSKLMGIDLVKVKNSMYKYYLIMCGGGIIAGTLVSIIVGVVIFKEYGYIFNIIVYTIFSIISILIMGIYYSLLIKRINRLSYVQLKDMYKNITYNDSNSIFDKIFIYIKNNLVINIVAVIFSAVMVIYMNCYPGELVWNKILDVDDDSKIYYEVNNYDNIYDGYVTNEFWYKLGDKQTKDYIDEQDKKFENIIEYIKECGGEFAKVNESDVIYMYENTDEMLNGQIFIPQGYSDDLIKKVFEINNIDKETLGDNEAIAFGDCSFLDSCADSNETKKISYSYKDGEEKIKEITVVNKVDKLPIMKYMYGGYCTIIVNNNTYSELMDVYARDVEMSKGGLYEESRGRNKYELYIKGISDKQWENISKMSDEIYITKFCEEASFFDMVYIVKNIVYVILVGIYFGVMFIVLFLLNKNKCVSKKDNIARIIEKMWVMLVGILVGTIISMNLFKISGHYTTEIFYYRINKCISYNDIKVNFFIAIVYIVICSIFINIKGLVSSKKGGF